MPLHFFLDHSNSFLLNLNEKEKHCSIELSPRLCQSTSFTSLSVWSVIYTPTVFACYWFTCLAVAAAAAACLLVPAVLNAARFSPGQFGWRCVQLPHSPSHPRPFLAGLSPSQLAIQSERGRGRDTHHTRRRATPPRLGNGQNAYWSALLPQVSFPASANRCVWSDNLSGSTLNWVVWINILEKKKDTSLLFAYFSKKAKEYTNIRKMESHSYMN